MKAKDIITFSILLVIYFQLPACSLRSARLSVRLRISSPAMFKGLFGGSGDKKTAASPVAPVAKVDQAKIQSLKANLEKISNTQNRNYEEEAKARAPLKKELADKQVTSFNFQKTNEFPNLYKGWIKSDGDQIAKQMIASTKSALKSEKYIEIIFDPVPNLDEVSFGTEWNKKLRMEVAANLKVPDYATNRGGPAVLEWSNLYWANRLVEGAGLKNAIALSISGDGTKGQFLPTLANNLQLIRLSDAKRATFAGISAFIVLSPCQDTHYKDAKALGDKYGVPVIALNAPYSFRYDIGGGAPWQLTYVMKRIPKGWIYRQFPRDFEAIIEGPKYEIFKAASFPKQPSLVEVSRVSMAASSEKYGAAGNDRIFQNRL